MELLIEYIVDVIKNFDPDNIYLLFLTSILGIIVFAFCVQSLSVSRVEVLLMGRKEDLRRLCFTYFILFILLGVENYCFVINELSLVILAIVSVLLILVCIPISVLKKRTTKTRKIEKCIEIGEVLFVMVALPLFIPFVSVMASINITNSVILCSLVETVMVAFMCLCIKSNKSVYSVNINEKKWYVFKRIDNTYLLCGNERSVELSTKIKLIKLDELTKTYFAKED